MPLVSPVIAELPVAVVYHRYWLADPPEAFNRIVAEGAQPTTAVAGGATGRGMIVAVAAVRALSHVPLLMAA